MKKILLNIFFIIFFLITAENVSADVYVVSTSAQVVMKNKNLELDPRKDKLENFLTKYNSPLANYSEDFIYWADKYDIDWRLVPAISGVESTFAKRYPKGSYNAYGWANGKYRFTSWENSIEVVSQTLREKYYDRGATDIDKIARRYAPPSTSWSWKVKYFMNEIDSTPVEFDL